MMRSATSILLILSLATLILCGLVMCMDFLAHYSVLAGSIPVQPALVVLVGLVAVIGSVVSAPLATPGAVGYLSVFLYERSPGPRLPLADAFSDGLIHPKVF